MTIAKLQEEIHQTAIEHGWWDLDRSTGEILMLMVTELAEAMEAHRMGNPPSDKIGGFTQIEEELVDTIIRILDFAGAKQYNLCDALLVKMAYNKTRPYRHGGKAA